MGQILINRHGGTRLKYNLFVQPDEPTIRDGLWIKTPNAVTVSDVLLKSGYNQSCKWANEDNNIFKNVNFSGDTTYVSLQDDNAHRMFDDNYIQDPTYLYFTYCKDLCRLNILTGTREVVKESVCSEYLNSQNAIFFKGVLYFSGNSRPYGKYYFQGTPIYDLRSNAVVSGSTEYKYAFEMDGYGYELVPKPEDNHNLTLHKINLDTNTLVSDVTVNNGQYGNGGTGISPTSNISLQFMYNNALYYLLCNSGYAVLAKVNFSDGSLTTIFNAKLPISSTMVSFNDALFYGGKVYMFFNGSTPVETGYINVDTGTYTIGETEPPSVKNELTVRFGNRFLVIPGIKFGTNNNIICGSGMEYDLINSVQPPNTLLLQSGNTYEMRVINTDKQRKKMEKYSADIQNSSYFRRKPDFSISDAWYYDTDFKEYPTYIGNGIAWTKIKN